MALSFVLSLLEQLPGPRMAPIGLAHQGAFTYLVILIEDSLQRRSIDENRERKASAR